MHPYLHMEIHFSVLLIINSSENMYVSAESVSLFITVTPPPPPYPWRPRFQDPWWIPETTDNAEPYICHVFLIYTY